MICAEVMPLCHPVFYLGSEMEQNKNKNVHNNNMSVDKLLPPCS
jgi:hypothetical protein